MATFYSYIIWSSSKYLDNFERNKNHKKKSEIFRMVKAGSGILKTESGSATATLLNFLDALIAE